MKKIFNFKWLSVLMLALLLVGCGTADEKTKEDSQGAQSDESGYKVKDDRGVEVAFDAVPKTVVSLQPSNTEILFALGVGDKIVGATDYDTYPAEALEIERVSDSMVFNSERILELNPDVVIAYTIGEKDALKVLEDAGVKVFVIQSATSFEDVYGDIEQLATVMGVEDKGEQLNKEIKAKIADVQEKVKEVETPKNAYYEVSPSPSIYTVGGDTFQQEILDAANVINVFSDLPGWPQVSEENIIAKNPEVILVPSMGDKGVVEEVLGRNGWNTIQAVQNKQVFSLDQDTLSRPGPRIGEAVELVAKAVYPELFQ
ncbi:ABC transporter substrate-binding protein [Lysinibacillus contaminans]|uniref:ABC transporter substrate-binding protein n=1 Tax=Lysinibacillus contaminans TaxID=1293441 RepID=UPI0009EC13E5|nr:cobalamin-binding protein [Lysinibacillus contaminans]